MPRMIITRYINKQILQATLALTLILLVVTVLSRLLNYLAQASRGELDPAVLTLLMSYRLPDFLQLILPLALLLGMLLALGRLYADSEMVVLTATGMSQRRLLLSTWMATLLVTAVVALLTLRVAPDSLRRYADLLEAQRNLSEFDLMVPGLFQNIARGERTTYAERIDASGMQKVFMHESATNRVIVAESAIPIEDEEGARFVVFRNGTITEGSNGVGEFALTAFDEWGVRLPPRDLGIAATVEEKAMSNGELLSAGGTEQLAELHWRLSLIVLVPMLSLLAVPLSKVSPRQGRFAKLVPAIVLYIFYLGLLLVSRDWLAEGRLPMIVGLWWVHALFLVIGMLMYSGRLNVAGLGRVQT